MVQWSPKAVRLNDFSNPKISSINCGGNHSAMIDEIGRLFMCGKGDAGQVGNSSYQDEIQPYFISRIPDKVLEVACGEEHTIILTRSGEIFSMGSN
jgi:alpha-tubulin suppressor-like RCC1 family protein